jgi:phage shock protein A
MADQLRAEVQVLDDALRASEEDIAKLQGRLREARNKQSNIQTRLETANNRFRMRDMYAGPKTQEAFSRFGELERRADEAEGRAEAMGLGVSKTLDEEINELRQSDKVDAELAALKLRLSGNSGGNTNREG